MPVCMCDGYLTKISSSKLKPVISCECVNEENTVNTNNNSKPFIYTLGIKRERKSSKYDKFWMWHITLNAH